MIVGLSYLVLDRRETWNYRDLRIGNTKALQVVKINTKRRANVAQTSHRATTIPQAPSCMLLGLLRLSSHSFTCSASPAICYTSLVLVTVPSRYMPLFAKHHPCANKKGGWVRGGAGLPYQVRRIGLQPHLRNFAWHAKLPSSWLFSAVDSTSWQDGRVFQLAGKQMGREH
ncbi:hypothetical protein BB8028_0003g13140 [Beauveria bassiana]|uniref:Uncharacterized protein n=1 Tax=Beauveria bassiana TaxID=176275 RepID=A0A2S7Y9K9_BEABA|nr:hypothetical protein BB8028_0003g13140 [Beauveria bassiana]